jgi:hypothetical protein
MDVYVITYTDVVCNINHNLILFSFFYSGGVYMKSSLLLGSLFILVFSFSFVSAQEQQCSYIAPRESSFGQNTFIS